MSALARALPQDDAAVMLRCLATALGGAEYASLRGPDARARALLACETVTQLLLSRPSGSESAPSVELSGLPDEELAGHMHMHSHAHTYTQMHAYAP
jgi:hypothetical protein